MTIYKGKNMNIMVPQEFNRDKHVYVNDDFSELLKDAVLFFNGTPVIQMPPPEKFSGPGVYAIYCVAKKGLYAPYGKSINRMSYDIPIYVGKAVPPGWRQSRQLDDEKKCFSLYRRLSQHAQSIAQSKSLSLNDFVCRFSIFEGGAVDMIAAVEAAIISKYSPLWNSVVDGFGNHNPGKKRLSGKKTQWDCLHPGREWAKNMNGDEYSQREIEKRVKDFLLGKIK